MQHCSSCLGFVCNCFDISKLFSDLYLVKFSDDFNKNYSFCVMAWNRKKIGFLPLIFFFFLSFALIFLLAISIIIFCMSRKDIQKITHLLPSFWMDLTNNCKNKIMRNYIIKNVIVRSISFAHTLHESSHLRRKYKDCIF